jgi:type IV pilus assembly protein PilA
MQYLRKRSGFTLIELLVVILILAILMAIALPLYLRAVRDSERQTCRSNMQTIAVACQAYKVRNIGHFYPGVASTTGPLDLDLDLLVGTTDEYDLQALPVCPNDLTPGDSYDGNLNADGTITIYCQTDDAAVATFHNELGVDKGGQRGFTPGQDSR